MNLAELNELRLKRFMIEVPGKAIAQARPRVTFRTGQARAYEPARCRDYKEYIRQCAFAKIIITEQMQNYKGAIELKVIEYRQLLKRFNKNERMQALKGLIAPISRPDCDNVLKSVMDALTGVFWRDDAQIVRCRYEKFYSEQAELIIYIKFL